MPPETAAVLVETPTRSREALSQLEKVVTQGDLAGLSPGEKVALYGRVCESLGLNPLTRPFEYLTLNGRQILYVRKDATDQLRKINGISVTGLTRETVGDLLIVTAEGVDRHGRTDSAIGAVSVKGLGGSDLANAYMRAETKSKRRLTLSLAGLGWMDESEVGDVRVESDAPVAETRVQAIAARRLGNQQTPAPETPEPASTAEEAVVDAADSRPAASEPPPPLPKDTWGRRLHGQAKKAGLTHQDLHDHAVQRWGVSSITELDAHQRADLMEMVEAAIEAPPRPVTPTGEVPEASGAGEDGVTEPESSDRKDEAAAPAGEAPAPSPTSVAIPTTAEAFQIFAAAVLKIDDAGSFELRELAEFEWEEVFEALAIEDYEAWFAGCSRELRAAMRDAKMSPRDRAARAGATA